MSDTAAPVPMLGDEIAVRFEDPWFAGHQRVVDGAQAGDPGLADVATAAGSYASRWG